MNTGNQKIIKTFGSKGCDLGRGKIVKNPSLQIGV